MPSGRVRIVVCAAWLAFVWATTRWYSWQETIDLVFGSDMEEYERVARAAPGFTSETLLAQHANRFVPHYVVGLLADALHVGVRTLYYVLAFALLLAVLFLVDRTVTRLRPGVTVYTLCIGALVANPYLYRFLAICPARLGDSLFVLGGLLALLGTVRARGVLLASGLVLATLARSEAAVALVLLAPFGVVYSPAWRARALGERRVAGAAAVLLPLAAYACARVASRSFSESDYPGFMRLTVFGTLRDLPQSADTLGIHGARVLVGIAAAGGVVAGILVLRRLVGGERLPFAFWAAAVAGAGVSGEVVLLNPDWIRGNQPLLAAIGTAFFVVAAAAAAATLPPGTVPPLAGAIAAAGIALASLNHRYTAISPVDTRAQYAALAIAGAAIAAGALALAPRLRR